LRPSLKQAYESECPKPAQWFAAESQAKQACAAPDVKLQTDKAPVKRLPDSAPDVKLQTDKAPVIRVPDSSPSRIN
jgi:hypothetical protein